MNKAIQLLKQLNHWGVRENLLYRWKQQIEDESVELKRLRKENKLLRMEKDILKKACAFFAKEMK